MSRLLLICALVLAPSREPRAQSREPVSDTLHFTHFDVGQGDATLITTPNKRRILIDAGPDRDLIVTRLRRLGVDTIDFLVATHNHPDHIGGIPAVFAGFVIRKYLDNNMPCGTELCGRVAAAAASEPGLVNIDGGIADTVDGVIIRMLPQTPRDSTDEDDNSLGLVISIIGSTFRAIYTGDAGEKPLRRWMTLNVIPRANLVSASRHGAASAWFPEWQEATKPSAVIVSVGRNNRLGYPSPDVMREWAESRAKVFRTDYLGTIEVSVARAGGFSVQFLRDSLPRR